MVSTDTTNLNKNIIIYSAHNILEKAVSPEETTIANERILLTKEKIRQLMSLSNIGKLLSCYSFVEDSEVLLYDLVFTLTEVFNKWYMDKSLAVSISSQLYTLTANVHINLFTKHNGEYFYKNIIDSHKEYISEEECFNLNLLSNNMSNLIRANNLLMHQLYEIVGYYITFNEEGNSENEVTTENNSYSLYN